MRVLIDTIRLPRKKVFNREVYLLVDGEVSTEDDVHLVGLHTPVFRGIRAGHPAHPELVLYDGPPGQVHLKVVAMESDADYRVLSRWMATLASLVTRLSGGAILSGKELTRRGAALLLELLIEQGDDLLGQATFRWPRQATGTELDRYIDQGRPTHLIRLEAGDAVLDLRVDK